MTADADTHGLASTTGPLKSGTHVRLRSGARLTVMHGAAGEWTVQTVARLLPGSIVDVVAGSGPERQVMPALIVRSEVIALDPWRGPRYEARLLPVEGGSPGGAIRFHGNELLTDAESGRPTRRNRPDSVSP